MPFLLICNSKCEKLKNNCCVKVRLTLTFYDPDVLDITIKYLKDHWFACTVLFCKQHVLKLIYQT